MAPHTWVRNGADSVSGNNLAVSDRNHKLYYRGNRISEAIYRGNVVWKKETVIRESDVNIWDWDGTLVKSFSAMEFIQMVNDLPTWDWPSYHRKWTANLLQPLLNTTRGNPERYDKTEILLEPDGYNWDLQSAYYNVVAFGRLDVGLIYKCDGVIAWVDVPYDNCEAKFGLWAQNDTATIEYGDGSSATISPGFSGMVISAAHIYEKAGRYIVKFHGSAQIGGLKSLDGGVQQIVTEFSIDTLVEATAGIGGVYPLPATSHVYGAYVGNKSSLSVGAFKRTDIMALGLGNAVAFNKNDTLAECFYLRHLNVPAHILDFGDNSGTEFGNFTVYSNTFGLSAFPALSHIILPKMWTGPLYITSTASLHHLIFPGHTRYFGRLRGLGRSCEYLAIWSGVNAMTPDYMELRFPGQMNDNFKVEVPYAVDRQYVTGNASDAGTWVIGEQLYQQVFSSMAQQIGSDVSPYTIAAARYTNYWTNAQIVSFL